MTFKSLMKGILAAGMVPIVLAQENVTQQDLLLDVLLGAYNGGAQTYADKTNTPANTLTREELEQLRSQLAQLQVLVTDENGQLDLDKANALLNLASHSDYEVMGIKASNLQEPLQMLQYVSEHGKDWQSTLLELKEKNQPLIDRTLSELSNVDGEQGAQSLANVMSVMLGAGLAIEEMAQESHSQQGNEKVLTDEVDYLKALAEKDLPSLLHTNIHHQFDALISRLKIAYANTQVGEEPLSNTNNNILAVKYFLSQANGQLTQSEYEQLLVWLDRLGEPYQEVRQQVADQHIVLTKDTK